MTAAARSAVDPHHDDAIFARELAERAGRVLRERYERVERIDYKSAKDVVTEVDHLSERLVIEAIHAAFPTDGILAEESGAHHAAGKGKAARDGAEPASSDGSAPAGRALAVGRTWIIDPLDGTVNYANGLPFFCVSIGLAVDGRPVAGAVHDPMRDETFWATADGPAMLNDRPIHASEKGSLGDFVIQAAVGGRAVATRVRNLRKAIRVSRNVGSSALALAYVANGRFDAFIQSAGMSAWDIAAAGLVAERAGAIVTDMAGGPWFDVDRATRQFGAIAAPAPHHAELLRIVG